MDGTLDAMKNWAEHVNRTDHDEAGKTVFGTLRGPSPLGGYNVCIIIDIQREPAVPQNELKNQSVLLHALFYLGWRGGGRKSPNPKKSTAPEGLPRRSPTPVLTGPCVG